MCIRDSNYIEYALAKPFRVDTDTQHDDLPNEYIKKKIMLEESKKLEELIKLKDDIMMDALSKKGLKNYADWENLGRMYEKQLRNYQMVCAYCGEELNETTVNTACLKNKMGRNVEENVISEEIPCEFSGNERHFFGRPLVPFNSFISEIIIDIKASTAFNAIRTGPKEAAILAISSIKTFDSENTGNISIELSLIHICRCRRRG
eukprot:TRINITY_DN26532_c0_g2_i1.p1 TRINITY_DN26532_c0_g2~~TRINITY_DN26532_c0_g2_i1.p1  ORF type:complete len:226 (-),score=45.22 TRINITY_DN26532_c0_g2_i1:40-654(-)